MGNSKNSSEVLIAALTGAFIGASIALLYAPDSGKATRTKIRREVERTSERLENAALELKGNVVDILDYKGDKLGYLIGSAIARGTLTSNDVIKMLETQIKKLTSKST